LVEGKKMSKLELMEKFMKTFVGNGFHLIIREKENSLLVHTIEIMQKVNETCPIKDISVGDYFLHLLATDLHGAEASITCNWSRELLQNLLENYRVAKEAGQKEIAMFRNPLTNDTSGWMLAWGNREQPKAMQPAQMAYVS
jgi:hypothetical protein